MIPARYLCLFLLMILFAPSLVQAQWDTPFCGGWEWVQTVYVDSTTITPADVGHTVQLLFLEDHTFIRYHDRVPIQESFWELGCINVYPYMVEFLATGVGDYWHWGIGYGETDPVLTLVDSIQLPNGSGRPASVIETYDYVGTVPADQITWGSLKAEYGGAQK